MFTFYVGQHGLSQRSFIKDKISGERYQDHWSSGISFDLVTGKGAFLFIFLTKKNLTLSFKTSNCLIRQDSHSNSRKCKHATNIFNGISLRIQLQMFLWKPSCVKMSCVIKRLKCIQVFRVMHLSFFLVVRL